MGKGISVEGCAGANLANVRCVGVADTRRQYGDRSHAGAVAVSRSLVSGSTGATVSKTYAVTQQAETTGAYGAV